MTKKSRSPSPRPTPDASDVATDRSETAAAKAAELVSAYSNVLDIGADNPRLARALPEGCDYRSAPELPRDLAKVAFANGDPADVITLLGGLDREARPVEALRDLAATGRPVVLSTRHSAAWLKALAGEAGFRLQRGGDLGGGQRVFKAVPGKAEGRPKPKKVLVLSYYNDPNFGDRLGFHVINSLLPADVVVTHASVKPWRVPDEDFDLLILGIGNSLNAATVARPELHELIARIPHTLGLFGTQYRYQYRELIDPTLMDKLLDSLTTWWARYEEDILAFGRGRENVRHLGDLLISAFPLATPTDRRTMVVLPDIKNEDIPLDRLIQRLQMCRRVNSARIHPLLCALTSAEEVQYQEQQEDPYGRTSGKFRSQLYDVFGRAFEESTWFRVDRDAVARYKLKVEANLAELRAQIVELLA